jgi:serine/threonine-protein kinase
VKRGLVAKQIPAAGTRLGESAQVTLVVSTGLPRVVVPKLGGQTEADARTALSALGLRASVARTHALRRAGVVLAESPAAGRKIPVRSVVRLTVSSGPIVVPRVVGLSSDAATRALRASGFAPTVVLVSASVSAGVVVAQRPAGGTRVGRAGAVTLDVARLSVTTTTTRSRTTTSGGTSTRSTTIIPQ